MSLSLTKLLKDPSLLFDNERIAKKTKEVEKDKKNLLTAASKYNVRHQQEIEEGTLKRQKLITDGRERGLNEEDSLAKYGRFLPSKFTPILNFLYFMMRDENIDEDLENNRQKYNQQYGGLLDNYEYNKSGNIEDVKELENVIYGECSVGTFKKLKKLKSLCTSPNEHEAYLAFRVCNQLCKQLHIDFNKIPVNN